MTNFAFDGANFFWYDTMCFNLRAGKGRTGVPRAATPHIPAGKYRLQVPCAGGRTNAAPPAQERFPGWWRVFAPCSGGVGPAPSRAALCSGCCPSASIPHTASPFRRFPTKARDAVFRGGPICPGKSTGEALEPVPGRDPAYSAGKCRPQVPCAAGKRGARTGAKRHKYPAGDPASSRREVQAAYSLCGLQPARHKSVSRAAEQTSPRPALC